MAQNITLLGASYPDVPQVVLPKTGGGTAAFTDVSDTTATAADVAQGKIFHLPTGEQATGTASGGGGDEAYKFLDGSLSGAYVNNTITKLRNYALDYYTDHDFSFSSTSTTSLGYNVFQGSNITSFSAPNLTGTTHNGSAFKEARKCTFIDLGEVARIRANFAYNANALAVLVLRRTSVVTLDNVSAFGNTPIRGYNSGSGTIYVPSNLISSYKTASNWSTIFNEGHVTFSAIEGSIYE